MSEQYTILTCFPVEKPISTQEDILNLLSCELNSLFRQQLWPDLSLDRNGSYSYKYYKNCKITKIDFRIGRNRENRLDVRCFVYFTGDVATLPELNPTQDTNPTPNQSIPTKVTTILISVIGDNTLSLNYDNKHAYVDIPYSISGDDLPKVYHNLKQTYSSLIETPIHYITETLVLTPTDPKYSRRLYLDVRKSPTT